MIISGIIEHPCLTRKMKKITIAVVVFLLLIGLVFAYDTVYNPYTGKLDYVNAVGNYNMTGRNMTFGLNDYICFMNCTNSYIVWNGTTLVIKVN